jgi:hypothetical protein
MRTETITVQVGEDVGPVDWDHPIAKGMPTIWREAAAEPALCPAGCGPTAP